MQQGLAISPAVLAEITAHARRDYPRECIGALIGKHIVTRAIAFTNHSRFARTRFRVATDELLAARAGLRAGESLLGFYHSHPDRPATCSPDDVHGDIAVIIGVDRNGGVDTRAWQFAPELCELQIVACEVE